MLTFPRARAAYDQLMRERIWANAAAKKEIATLLRGKGMLTPVPQTRPFGNLSRPVPHLDSDYVNFRVVSFGLFNLDDMAAALGNFAFRVVVAGGVAPVPKTSKFQVTISDVGVCIRDSYDFNGSQFLGFWDEEKHGQHGQSRRGDRCFQRRFPHLARRERQGRRVSGVFGPAAHPPCEA